MKTTETSEAPDLDSQAGDCCSTGEFHYPCILSTNELSVHFGKTTAVANVSIAIPKHCITTVIGPSGCGKSTLLKQLNRMNDFTCSYRMEGQVCFQGQDIFTAGVNTAELRRRIGMVYQRPNVFPASTFENVAWGVRLHNLASGAQLDTIVEQSPIQANLWGEVKGRLGESSLNLSGGQQQRLCIARALAMQPDVLLLDEPCSALDAVSTGAIESLLRNLQSQLTIVLVTHDLAQARRLSGYTAFMENGRLIEFGETAGLLQHPQHETTRLFIEASSNQG